MRLLLQRVSEAWVDVEGTRTTPAGTGLVALVGLHRDDPESVMGSMADKMVNLRVFGDEQGRMNRSLLDVAGDLVLVSQFTLYADVRRGRRPGFTQSMEPERASPMFDRFVEMCKERTPRVTTGKFGAMMQVHLVNDGPVTILLDSWELGLHPDA